MEWGDRFLEFLRGVVLGGGAVEGPDILNDKSDEERREKGKGKEKEEEEEPTVWRVRFTPKEGVSVRVLGAVEVEDVSGGGGGGEAEGVDRVGFLPRWFWEEVKGGRVDGEVSEMPERVGDVKKDVVIPPGWQI